MKRHTLQQSLLRDEFLLGMLDYVSRMRDLRDHGAGGGKEHKHTSWPIIFPKVPWIFSGIYIYIYMLWSYYLGHVWGSLMVTNWATYVFLKRLFVKKNTIK